MTNCSCWCDIDIDIAAAKSFGKFKDSFLAELHAEITSHIKQGETGLVTQPVVAGIVVHDSEVLEPEPARAGGLMRKDVVSNILNVIRYFEERKLR